MVIRKKQTGITEKTGRREKTEWGSTRGDEGEKNFAKIFLRLMERIKRRPHHLIHSFYNIIHSLPFTVFSLLSRFKVKICLKERQNFVINRLSR